MTSDKQKIANKNNALKSTGPKTEAGKNVSSKNSLTHGLTSQSLMHPGCDNPEEFKDFTKKIYDCFCPENDLQMFFVNRAISCMWRLKRIIKIEEIIFNDDFSKTSEDVVDKMFNYIKDKMSVIGKYETSLERSLFKTLNEIKKLKEM